MHLADVRTKTGGVSSPQLLFCHWEMITEDPFWQPRTEDELEEFGESASAAQAPNMARDLMNKVRRRKGLKVDEKVVAVATKQRTLARKR